MKKYAHFLIPAAVLLGLLLGRYWLPSKSQNEASSAHPDAIAQTPSEWTCSMHPQVRLPEPGLCPICAMDLIPAGSSDQNSRSARALTLDAHAQALAEIETVAVKREIPEVRLSLSGKLTYDETRQRVLTARFPARIDTLYVNYTGMRVQKGDHLARIYSPELQTARSELLTAWRHDPQGRLAKAARNNLLDWDLQPEQIDELLAGKEATDELELLAPMGGVVVESHVREGDYVETGERLFSIADLDRLWLELDAFESDLSLLRYGQAVTFNVEAWPGRQFDGKLVFINPKIDASTRTSHVRVIVPNPDGRLKPGMFARGEVRVRLLAGEAIEAPELDGKWISPMHPEIIKDGPGQCDVCGMDLVPAEQLGHTTSHAAAPAPLLIPTSAVLRTGKRAIVYVELEPGSYEGRRVELGRRAGDFFLLNSGLSEGERVVSKGAFKLDSELQIRARPSMMLPEDGEPDPPSIRLDEATFQALLPHYLSLQQALAADRFEDTQAPLQAMLKVDNKAKALTTLLYLLSAARDLDAIRRPHFETLSNAMIETAITYAPTLTQPLYRMGCPMVYDDRGAEWLQTSDELVNPYFGAEMLYCGEELERLDKPANTDEHATH